MCRFDKNRKTTEEFIIDARKVHGSKYDYSKVKYVNNQTKVCIICPEHGEFWQKPNGHLNGKGCPICAKASRKEKLSHSIDFFIQKASKLHNDAYDYSEANYINFYTKVLITCKKCGLRFYQAPSEHLRGQGCPHCHRREGHLLTNNEFINRAKNVHGAAYDYSQIEYKDSKTPILITCNKCKCEFLITPNSHLQGKGCPRCNQSKLEQSCGLKLHLLNIEFICQMKFNWLLSSKSLRLDFFLPKYNVAIECQGIQHFMPVYFFGGEKEFTNRSKLDAIKKQLCEEHGIKIFYYSNLKQYNEFLGEKVYHDLDDLIRNIVPNQKQELAYQLPI